tara:strand:- start:232 stop:756 length:525 start_codon:yes stop_codon:yes gene_type:complete
MIISIIGSPCSGKSTLLRSIISELGGSEDIEPLSLFKCQKHNDILIIGRYPEKETFGGTDRLSYSTISKFQEFINEQVKHYRHIIFEGDRFTNNIEWLLDNHDTKCYLLIVDEEEEKRRHESRGDTQNETWLRGRRTQMNNLRTNFNLMDKLEIRDTRRDNVKNEILHECSKIR